MRTLIICLLAALALIGSTGCSRVTYSQATYAFMSPPKTQLGEDYTTIHYKLHGDAPDRTFSKLNVEVPGLTWSDDEKTADIIVDVFIGQTGVRNKRIESKAQEKVSLNTGRTWIEMQYTGLASIETPTRVELYDARTNTYHSKLARTWRTGIHTPMVANDQGRANLVLNEQIRSSFPGHKTKAANGTKAMATKAVASQYTRHRDSARLRIPKTAADNPTIATIASRISSEGLNQSAADAYALYAAIGHDNQNDKGEDLAELNQGVMIGMISCLIAQDKLDEAKALRRSLTMRYPTAEVGYGIDRMLR